MLKRSTEIKILFIHNMISSGLVVRYTTYEKYTHDDVFNKICVKQLEYDDKKKKKDSKKDH